MISNKKTAYFILIAVFFVCLDRFLKSCALVADFKFNIWGEFLKFNFIPNPNIAFSLPLGGLFLNLLIPLILLILLVVINKFKQADNYLDFGAMIFIFSGAVSNYYDRLVYGYVIDYFDLKYFTVFNVADIMIVLSAGLIILINFKKENKLKNQN